MRLAFKVAYDGAAMSGSQRQPHGNTVEDRILKALTRVGVIEDPRAAGFAVGARTDKGVSAVGNTFAVTTDFPPDAVLPALAGRIDDVWLWGVATCPDDHHPRRHALGRRYWYFAPADGDLGLAREAFGRFVGAHDFRGFCKHQPEDAGYWRTVRAATVEDGGGAWRFSVQADAFLWQQVRRMVGAVLEVAAGRATLDALDERLANGEGTVFPISPPEPLVLAEVIADVPWRVNAAARDAAVERLARRARTAALRVRALEAMAGALRDAVPGPP